MLYDIYFRSLQTARLTLILKKDNTWDLKMNSRLNCRDMFLSIAIDGENQLIGNEMYL